MSDTSLRTSCARPWITRSKHLAFGGTSDEQVTNRLGAKTLEALTTARNVERVTMTDSAMRLWSDVYTKLSEGSPGLLGSITARAEAQTIRLALVYALLDQSRQPTGPAVLEVGIAQVPLVAIVEYKRNAELLAQGHTDQEC